MGSMEEFEGRRRGMLITWECCNPCVEGGGYERFPNSGSVFGRRPGRGYTGNRRSPTL